MSFQHSDEITMKSESCHKGCCFNVSTSDRMSRGEVPDASCFAPNSDVELPVESEVFEFQRFQRLSFQI